MKFKILLVVALAAVSGMLTHASVIDANDARDIALEVLSQRQGGNRLNSSQSDIQLTHTRYSSLSPTMPVFYIFNDDKNGGWVIVAAEDRAQHVLGYNLSGKFDADAMPCNVSAWLDEYDSQIEHLQLNPQLATTPTVQGTRLASLPDISPLVKSTWDQGSPYNTQCPKISYSYPLVGCTATAMAQVMYYYKYPTSACLEIPSYVTSTKKMTVQALPATTFDWDNMMDSYSGSYNSANKAAVATLSRYCGQAVCMDYGLNSSGAYIELIPYALVHFFGYDKLEPAHMEIREKYDDETWTLMLHEELSKGHPLPYSGNNGSSGGHSFIVDGYRNGSFHLNWGWSGNYDGYFQLSAFTPSTHDYTQSHRAVFGIERSRADLNSDGMITIADISVLIDMLLGIVPSTSQSVGDVNLDGTVSIKDVSVLIDKLLGDSESEVNSVTYTVNGVSFKMALVEGGTFMMGATAEQGTEVAEDEFPVHQVTLSSFYIGTTEVTQELWQAVMGTNPGVIPGPTLPVNKVSWDDCQLFIAKLNTLTGKQFRLPTESEWEFAARGGVKSRGYKYAGSNDLAAVAWYGENAGASFCMEVGLKAPNELGLYDMSGNVSEWCSTYWADYLSTAQTNPQDPVTGTHRLCRGGNWYFESDYCRVSNRTYSTPDNATSIIGLRLAL